MCIIREAESSDLEAVLKVERLAFGQDEEADLVRMLLNDRSAKPLLSLAAFRNDHAVGHILFTRVRLVDTSDEASAVILAPMAVIPEAQGQGIGGKLIREGLRLLAEKEVDLVFVLGHPEYYPRHGFMPAASLGFEAPYPIAEEHADAWMVQALRPDLIGRVTGTVVCADSLNRPEYWLECD